MDDIYFYTVNTGLVLPRSPGPWSHAQPEQWCSDGALCRMHKISTIPSIIKYWSYWKSI